MGVGAVGVQSQTGEREGLGEGMWHDTFLGLILCPAHPPVQ
jgi:hypothetical protein